MEPPAPGGSANVSFRTTFRLRRSEKVVIISVPGGKIFDKLFFTNKQLTLLLHITLEA